MTEDTGVRTRTRVVGLVAGIVRWVGLVAAIILAVHVLLTVGDANQANWITSFFRAWADPLALGFKDLFLSKPDADRKLRVLINYGLAAIFWLIISTTLTRLLRRLA
jgi:Na+/H+ antiporter NhaA